MENDGIENVGEGLEVKARLNEEAIRKLNLTFNFPEPERKRSLTLEIILQSLDAVQAT